MKKLISILLALAMLCSMAIGLSACGSSPEEEFKSLEKQAFEDAVLALTEVAEKSEETKSTAVQSTATVHLSDAVLDLLSSSAGLDFEWLNQLSFDSTSQYDDGTSMGKIDISLAEDALLSISAISDLTNGKMYLSIPQLFKKHWNIDTASLADTENAAEITEALLNNLPDLEKLLPLVSKYYTMLIDSLDGATESDGEFSAGSASQTCKVYEVTLSEKQTATAAKAILQELAKDETVRTIFMDCVNAINAMETDDPIDPKEAYDEWIDEINTTIEVIDDDVLSDDADESVNDPFLSWKTFVHKKEIIGREISVTTDDETLTLSFGSAKSDDSHGIKLSAVLDDSTLFAIVGDFTETNDLMDGSITLTVEDEDFLYIDLSEIDTKKFEDGDINGRISLSFGEGLLDALDESGLPASISLSAVSLKFDIESTKDEATVVFGVYNGNMKLGSLHVVSRTIEVTDVEIPTSNTVDTPEEFLQSMDLEGYLSYLSEETELPDTIVLLLTYLIYQGGF